MAPVVKIANCLIKNDSKEEVREYLVSQGEEWTLFVDGELKKSNETNNRSLGDQRIRNSIDDDDNDKDYEMNMEKIMAKFSNFNSKSQSKSSLNNDDDDDDEDDTIEEDNHKEEENTDDSSGKSILEIR